MVVSERALKLGTDFALASARAAIKVGRLASTTSLGQSGAGNKENLGLGGLGFKKPGNFVLSIVPGLPLVRIEAGEEFCGVPVPDLRVRESAPAELGGEGYAKRDIVVTNATKRQCILFIKAALSHYLL